MNTTNDAKKNDLEKRLTDIVIRIEKSGLSVQDKEEIYAQISLNLHQIVLPVLMKYISKEELNDLDKNPSKVSVETFTHLMKQPFSDARVYEEVNMLANAVLDDVEKGLSEGGM